MTNLGGGLTVCDGCDVDLGNGSLLTALIVADHRDGIARTFHFCRDREDANGGPIIGCASNVLRPEVLAAYAAREPGAAVVASPLPVPPSPDPSLPQPDPSDTPPVEDPVGVLAPQDAAALAALPEEPEEPEAADPPADPPRKARRRD